MAGRVGRRAVPLLAARTGALADHELVGAQAQPVAVAEGTDAGQHLGRRVVAGARAAAGHPHALVVRRGEALLLDDATRVEAGEGEAAVEHVGGDGVGDLVGVRAEQAPRPVVAPGRELVERPARLDDLLVPAQLREVEPALAVAHERPAELVAQPCVVGPAGVEVAVLALHRDVVGAVGHDDAHGEEPTSPQLAGDVEDRGLPRDRLALRRTARAWPDPAGG